MIILDGWITIGTKLDTTEFDKEVSNLEDKIDSAEKKQELINQKTSQYENQLKAVSDEVNRLSQEYEKAVEKAEELNATAIKGATGSYENYQATLDYEEQVKLVDELAGKLDKAEAKQTTLKQKVAQSRLQYENSAKAIDTLRGKIQKINLKRQEKEFKEIEKSTSKVRNGIKDTVGKLGKMALAVFSIRSAFTLLTRASSTWGQYNEQYAKDLEYIRFALASGLAPILEKIVNLAQTLMAYVNYLTNALFGRPFFGSAKDFENMQKSASGVAKSTKEIKNNLAGFDEINVLGSNKGNETAGGITTPSVNLEEVEIPEWLVKIKDILKPVVDFFDEINKKYGPVATGIGVVVSALAGFYIIKTLIKLFTGLGKSVFGLSADFTGFFNALGKAVEAIAILWGLSEVIKSITDLIDTFSESGMTLKEVAELLGIVLGELAIAFIVLMGAMTLLKPSWASVAGALVVLGGLALVLATVSNLIKTFSASGMKLNEVIGLMSTILLSLVVTMGAVALLGPAMTAGLIPFLGVVGGISALLTVMALTLPTILDAIEKFIVNTAPATISIIEAISNGINIIITAIGTTLPPIIDSIGGLFDSIFGGIAKIIESVTNSIIKLQDSTIRFIEKLGPALNKLVDGIISAVTKLINFLISGIEYMVNLVISGVNKIIDAINSIGDNIGFTIPRVPEFEMPRFVPKLARGGIVAKPTQAIIGEAGREAVMPLDNNTEWMDILADKLSDRVETNNEQEITIRFEGTIGQFVRELKPYIEAENKRAGSRIITGGAY